MKWHIGCSGFMYRDWKGEFYPEGLAQKNWLAFYATHFNTLEINSTFYKFPTAASLEIMHNQTPADFLFSLKAPRLITHFRHMIDCKEKTQEFYAAIEGGLKEKFGAALFQFPPKFNFTDERLALLEQTLDNHFHNVLEFRNESWFRPEILQTLTGLGYTVSGLSHPQLPDLQQPICVGSRIYYRFHGIKKLFYSEYSPADLENVAETIASSQAEEAFIYFNNTASMAGLNNARALLNIIK